MVDFAKEVISVPIEHELKKSYLDYAMSVIVGRALPDVRDGLKPVHRRVLYAMRELGNDWNKAYKKSARVVGDVIGKYHPHGDSPVYDTIVRLAQPFSMRYVLIDGQGNFGSIDGDAAAAMRYTEVRMAKITHALLADLDKETVDFVPNYDGTETLPTVLPTQFPNLLINGTSGIAVGMATNIPPHNLNEVIAATIHLLHAPDSSVEELMAFMPGPDFPTAGIINGQAGIIEAYHTGRGRIVVRGRSNILVDEDTGKSTIIISELPYQVNKARLIEKIAILVKEKRLEGISALRDESDREGMRVVIEVKRGESAEVLLNNLYAQTQLQIVFGINMVALVAGQPKLLNLREVLTHFLQHRREVVTRRTIFELNKAKDKLHILEGLAVALANMDEMIALIKQSKSPQIAKEALLSKQWPLAAVGQLLAATAIDAVAVTDLQKNTAADVYVLSPKQAQAILDLRLHRLTGLEQEKIYAEYKSLLTLIRDLNQILSDPQRLAEVIESELKQIQSNFSDLRRTEICENQEDLSNEDLIPHQNVIVTLSNMGYIKSQALDQYQSQHRGGKGKVGTKIKSEEFLQALVVADTHDTLLCVSNKGKLYWLKTYRVPEAARTARGRPIVNLLPLAENEYIEALLPIKEYAAGQFIVMVTEKGVIKRMDLQRFARPRPSGIIAIELAEADNLVAAVLTNGDNEIMLFSSAGKAVRFKESDVREMGRAARGVRGMTLQAEQRVIAMLVAEENAEILTATSRGYGKRTAIEEYRLTKRGAQGVNAIILNEKNGELVAAEQVHMDADLVLVSDKGTLVRVPVGEISCVGRVTQGVRLIRLDGDELLVDAKAIDLE